MNSGNAPFTVWLAATRPRTLPLSLAPVAVGGALASRSGPVAWLPLLLCLVFAVLAQIAANFSNDYYDFIKGTDNKERVGPRRAVASGLVAPSTMLRATWLVCGLAFLTGLGLLSFGGWPLLVVGIASLICAVAYTGGPFPLGYMGLGDLFVFIFFGPVAVCTTLYIQCRAISQEAWILSAAIGLLATNILVANNYRDMENDRRSGKMTTVVRFGRTFAKSQFAAAHFVALFAPLLIDHVPGPALWVWCFATALLAPWAIRLCRGINVHAKPADLIRVLAQSGMYAAAYAAFLSFWLVTR